MLCKTIWWATIWFWFRFLLNGDSLRRGPGANIQDKAGYSALHYAALYGHTDCVRMLLSYEASPSLRDSRHSSPLHLAAWAGHQDIVKLLLTQSNRPVDPNLQVKCSALFPFNTNGCCSLVFNNVELYVICRQLIRPRHYIVLRCTDIQGHWLRY